jgi:hypothetical protein
MRADSATIGATRGAVRYFWRSDIYQFAPIYRDLPYVSDIAYRFTECRFVFANKAMAIGMGASEPADLIGKTDFGF